MLPDNPNDVARLIYLGLLLLALAFFAFGGGQRIGGKIRDLAIWGLIFAAAVVLYGFRDQLRRDLFPGSVHATSDSSMEITRSPDGHFWTEATIGGQMIEFMVDTGATDIVLNRRTARILGINPDSLTYSGRANTANGAVSTASVRLPDLSIGPFTDTNIPAQVTSGGLTTPLLGMSWLRRFDTIEIRGDRMLIAR